MKSPAQQHGERMQVGSPVRILMLLENGSYPDDTRVTLEGSSLCNAGYQVTVICPAGVSRRIYENVAGVHVYRYPKPLTVNGFVGYVWEYSYSLTMEFILSLYVLFRRGFDIVHTHAPPDMHVLIAGFYRLLGKLYVADQHDLSPELYLARQEGAGNRFVYGILCWFERLACKTADCVIITNETQRGVLVQRGGAQPERCHVVRNGPDARFFEPIEPLESLRVNGRLVIGYVGLIGVQDRVEILLRALHHLKVRVGRNDFQAVIVGTGPALRNLKQLAHDLELDQQVIFTGFLVGDDLLRHIASFDICATPDPKNPYNDSCTMIKMMEYMALAKPIVAFDLPEHRFSAADAALYAEPNNEHRFAECLEILMDSPRQRQLMGQIGRRRVVSELSWDKQKEHLLVAYRKLVPASNEIKIELDRPLSPSKSGFSKTVRVAK